MIKPTDGSRHLALTGALLLTLATSCTNALEDGGSTDGGNVDGGATMYADSDGGATSEADAGGSETDAGPTGTTDGGSATPSDGGTDAGATTPSDGGSVGDGGSAPDLILPVGTTWQWQLTDYPVDTSFDVEVYDVDLFEVSDATLTTLRDDGRFIICYFSAGTYEPWRPDVGGLPSGVKGDPLDPPFGDELWLDHREVAVRDLVTSRLDLAVERGCDGVEPDNVDGFDNDGGGLGLTAADQLAFNRFIADAAHARGLSVGLKNDLEQLDALVDDFDWALNEECYTYDECDAYADNFIAAGKAVLHAEYVSTSELNDVCAVTGPLGLSTLIKDIDLGAEQVTCP